MTDQPGPRGTPPSTKDLGRQLGAKAALWNAVADMVKEFGATWKWAHSEVTGAWSFRSYLPGDRFFVAMSLVDTGFEVSLNLKAEEWDNVAPAGGRETEVVDALREKALASGDEPAWIHVGVADEGMLPILAKLLFARGRRIQPPRTKKRKR